MRILGVDPGPTESAYCLIPGGAYGDDPMSFGKRDNEYVRHLIASASFAYDVLVVEKIESFGMAVGAEVFETVWWSGRFAQTAMHFDKQTARLPRKAIKLHLCGSMRAKDGNIRQALIDKYGGTKAIGKKASPGPLYGVAGDCWSALAVCVTYAETVAKQETTR